MQLKPLFVIIGKSAAGKDYLTEQYRTTNPDFTPCVSDTSRPKRPNEVEGKEYYFKVKEEMLKNKIDGDYWEWIEYVDNFYAFSKKELQRILNLGKIPFVKVEPDGYEQVVNSPLLKDFQIKTIYLDINEELQIASFKKRDPNITQKEIDDRLKTNQNFDNFFHKHQKQIDLHLNRTSFEPEAAAADLRLFDNLVKKTMKLKNLKL